MKTHPMGAEFFPCGRTDKRTDMMKLTVAFRDFQNAQINFPLWTVDKQQRTGLKMLIIACIFFSVTSKIKGTETFK
jgi:hypothetical protein